jgi:hypothetical protein
MRRQLFAFSVTAMSVLVLGSGSASAAAVGGPLMVTAPFSGTGEALSCQSLAQCTILGQTLGRTGVLPLAGSWTPAGAVISQQQPPSRSSLGNQVDGLSCLPATCVGVGSVNNGVNSTLRRIDVLSGAGVWSTTLLPAAHRGANVLFGVSCPTATSCTAVGTVATGARIAQTHSSITTITLGAHGFASAIAATHPTPGTVDSLTSVSCPTPNWCAAVGTTFGGAGKQWTPLIEVFNGTSWIQQQVSGLTSGYLLGVSCNASQSCVAVGSTNALANSSTKPIVVSKTSEGWNGQVLPRVGLTLNAVSCVALQVCMAVGSQTIGVSTTPQILADREGVWTADASLVLPRGSYGGEWRSVICLEANQCHLVGTTTSRGRPTVLLASPLGPGVRGLSVVSGSSAGGTVVRITGVNFQPGTIAHVGGIAVRPTRVLSTEVLTIVMPPHAPGPVPITVTTRSGTSSVTTANTFTYTAPPTT